MPQTAELICPRCGAESGMVARPPLAVCLDCGLPLLLTVQIVSVRPLRPDDLRTLTGVQRLQLGKLLQQRDQRRP